MRSSHWCVTLVTVSLLASSTIAIAQGQLPPNTGRPVGAPAGPPVSQGNIGTRPVGAPATQPVAQSNVAPRGTTVAVIDIKFIFENHTRFKQAMDGIKKDYDAFEAQVRTIEGNLRKQIEQLKAMQAGTPEFKQLEQQIATTRTQVQLDINNKQKERVDEEAQIYHHANQELQTAVQRFAERNGIDLVLQYSSAEIDPTKPDTVIRGLNRMVVYHNGLQITEQILQELNQNGPPPRQVQNPGGPPKPSTPTTIPNRTGPASGGVPNNGGGIPNTGGFPKTR